MRPPIGQNSSKHWKMEFEPMVKAHEQQGSKNELQIDSLGCVTNVEERARVVTVNRHTGNGVKCMVNWWMI